VKPSMRRTTKGRLSSRDRDASLMPPKSSRHRVLCLPYNAFRSLELRRVRKKQITVFLNEAEAVVNYTLQLKEI